MQKIRIVFVFSLTLVMLFHALYAGIAVTAAGSAIITNMVCSDTSNASNWSTQTGFNTGIELFGDRTGKTLVSCPAYLKGCDWIKPAYNSRAYTGSTLVTFNLTQPATVYMAFPANITSKPTWLNTFTKTSDMLTTSEGTWGDCNIYKKYFPAGSVSFGNNGEPSKNVYVVIVSTQIPTIANMSVTSHRETSTSTELSTVWSIQSNLQQNDLVYGDKSDRTFKIIPNSPANKYLGSDWIRPSISSGKAYASSDGNNLVSFTVTKNAMVYIGHTDLITAKPDWMNGWSKNGDKITVNESGTTLYYSVYEKYFPAGSVVTLGGNDINRSSYNNYFVIASNTYLAPIANLTFMDTDADLSKKWSISRNLSVNDVQYGDKSKLFTEIPQKLLGCDWIQTAFGSAKSESNPLARFYITKDMTVYLALDGGIGEKPSWMNGWTLTNMDLTNTDHTKFKIFAKYFAANSQVTLGPNGSSENMYTVFAKQTDKNNANIKTIEIGTELLADVESGTLQYFVSLPYGTTVETMPTVSAFAYEPASQVTVVMPQVLPGKAEISIVSIENNTKVYEVNFTVKPPVELTDITFDPDNAAPGRKSVMVTVTNNIREQDAITLVVGLYSGSAEDRVLENISFTSDWVLKNQQKEFRTAIDIPNDNKPYFLKAYVLGSLAQMKPYSQVYELNR